MRRLVKMLLVLVFGLALVAPAATAAQAAPFCGIHWGSSEKRSGSVTGEEYLTNVRAGRHACFDRLVLDVRGGRVSGYDVRYVKNVVNDPRGDVVPLRGGAKLQVTADVHANTPSGHASYVPADKQHLVRVSGFRTFRQVAWAGSFEGVTTVGLGVRARLPFRVFVLNGPHHTSMLVVDVAHRW
ncbi:hypothetical protein [Georgenia sp. SYP-B2076]|uniref:AMIN-like domain-containing (lipo)protein n=1 Tax=Georgenia sp. SYP-B2076 TaxID=2495881 RepID=UPI000F8CCBC7|nr:hypothetical protein [Georgenia sp. SYP-B2076]